jgi:hypothetical protein
MVAVFALSCSSVWPVYLYQEPQYAKSTQSICTRDENTKHKLQCLVPKSNTLKYFYSTGMHPPKVIWRVIGGPCDQLLVMLVDRSILKNHRDTTQPTSKK